VLRAEGLRSGARGIGHTSGHGIRPTLHCVLGSLSQLFAVSKEKEKDCLSCFAWMESLRWWTRR